MKLTRSTVDPVILSAIGIVFPAWTLIWCWLNWSLSNFFGMLLVSWFLGIHITMFAHRTWCHKSWVPSPIVNFWGLCFFSVSLVGNSIGWVGVHREHHRYCDTDKDPHSPYHKSWLKIQFLSYFNKVKPQYIVDLGRDRLHLWFYHWYWAINAAVFVIVGIVDIDLLGWWIAAIGLTVFKLHTINSLCHKTPWWLWPVQNSDTSTNSIGMVLLNINNGEAWHKNHHQSPGDWNFSRAWWQLDPPAWIIKLLVLCKLASVNR
jgi:stearoyl-CoA desaturase (delta-9 desaturase)